MKKFKGRSAQTVRMKNKPIKEGFKFFAICDATEGFVYAFKPSGRLEETRIASKVVSLAKRLPRRDNLSYVVAMDNYFTLPKAVKGLKDENIGVVGTARARHGWPSKEFKKVDDKRFNTLYTLTDKDGFKIMRWVDNNVVTMVSTLHDGTETITRQRKRPRKTTTNMSFVDTVWGGDWVKEISIPGVIDDYNHWMLGVDKSDQLIAYYRPVIRVQRYWMAMMFHGLDILRTNTYIVYKNRTEDVRPLDHKGFLIELLDAMIKRANYLTYWPTRQRSPTQATQRQQKKQRMGKHLLKLPPERFDRLKELHIPTTSDEGQRQCIYCCYLAAKEKADGNERTIKVKQPKRICNHCKVHLCVSHFDVYHSRKG